MINFIDPCDSLKRQQIKILNRNIPCDQSNDIRVSLLHALLWVWCLLAWIAMTFEAFSCFPEDEQLW